MNDLKMINVYNKIKEKVYRIHSRYYLRINSVRRNRKGKIRVGFLVHEPETWDKLEPLYEKLSNDIRFETFLIVIPSFDTKLSLGKTYGYEKTFFENRYKSIILAYKDNNIVDLKKYRFDFVFYQDHYDAHYPIEYRSYRLVKYTKICYIPYGYSLLKNCTEYFASNFVFLRNISILFAENISDGKAFEKLFIDNINNRIQKVEYLGYPPLEKYLNFPQIELVKRITWAPRWTYDDKLGGSHFMEYKDFFLDLAKKLPEQLIIRPHPMMFENFRQKGIMNHAQINDYVRSANRLGVPLDDRSPIDQILENTDLLITDISSVIVLFFMTGRPIIYCKCNMEPNDELRKMLDGIYIAENQNEIEYYINNILNNNDYLKSKRADIIKNNLFDVNYNSTNKIVENLYYSATN